MKLSKNLNIIQDYNNVSISFRNRYNNILSQSEKIRRVFLGRDSVYNNEEPITSKAEHYCDNLCEFLSQLLFPTNGNWIKELSGAKAGVKEDFLYVFRSRIKSAGFYHEMQDLLKSGILFNMGLVSCRYVNGLNYHTKDVIFDDFIFSQDQSENMRRVYHVERLTKSELSAEYDRIPEILSGASGGTYDVRVCYLPSVSPFVEGKVDSGVKYILCKYLEGTGKFLTVNGDSILQKFSVFPLSVFRANTIRPLSVKALGPTALLVELWVEFLYRTKFSNSPPFTMYEDTIAEFPDQISIRPDRFLPVSDKDRIPVPIQLPNETGIDLRQMQKLELDIAEIFKDDVIRRAKVVGLGPDEAVENLLNVYNDVEPLVSDVVSKTAQLMLDLTHKLLIDNEPEYKKKYSTMVPKATGIFAEKDTLKVLTKLSKCVNMSLLVQKLDPSSAPVVSGDKILRFLYDKFEFGDLLNSEDFVNKYRKALSDRSREVQDSQNQKDLSEANLANSKALGGQKQVPFS